MWGFATRTQQSFAAPAEAMWTVRRRGSRSPLRAYPRDQLLGLGQDIRHDGIDAGRRGMKSVALHELPVGEDPVEEEGIENGVVCLHEVGIDRIEGAGVVGAQIGRRQHAAQEHWNAALSD